MLKLKDNYIKQMLMNIRYDDLFGRDHELYTIKDDCIEFSIDMPTDFGKGDVFILKVMDKDVNKAGYDPLEYYDKRITDFIAEHRDKYYKAITPAVKRESEQIFSTAIDKLPKGFSVTIEAGFKGYQFAASLRFANGSKYKRTTVTASVDDKATLQSFIKELQHNMNDVIKAVKQWAKDIEE